MFNLDMYLSKNRHKDNQSKPEILCACLYFKGSEVS